MSVESMDLRPNHVNVWLAFADAVTDADLLSRYRAFMSAEERERETKFHFAVDRHRYLVTRALVRTTLSLYHPDIPPDAWTFEANAYGRPRITNADAGGLVFNVSHSASVIALAIGAGLEVGLDLEVLSDRSPPVELANELFAKKEAAALRSLPSAAQAMRFFEFWTLKESFIKACGKGLSIPLDKFSFDLMPDGSIRFDAHEDMGSVKGQWQFVQLLLPEVAVLALCVEDKPGISVDTSVNVAIPLMVTKPMPCQVVRRSHPLQTRPAQPGLSST